VTEDDIVTFQNNYRGGEEEADDLRGLYERFQGDMGVYVHPHPFPHPFAPCCLASISCARCWLPHGRSHPKPRVAVSVGAKPATEVKPQTFSELLAIVWVCDAQRDGVPAMLGRSA
jgi:hypothetical protein